LESLSRLKTTSDPSVSLFRQPSIHASREHELKSVQDYRTFYANYIVRSAGSSNEALIAAFASVERERFVGKGPWPIFIGSGYIPTISDDPSVLYQDILVGLATDRGINNGQPSLHARCLAACAPVAGESIVHIGAGTGYYTAILAALTGSTGKVVAYEIENDLSNEARKNLSHLPSVTVLNASATETAIPRADVIYVCAGATHPLAAWLDALNIGGRLAFPLTPNEGYGCMLKVTRRSVADYAASAIMRVSFIPCIGARDDASSNALTAALETQSLHAVRSLRRGTPPDSSAWCVGTGWWLSTAEIA
jgi:protein-L-isoaspartate(D-aspartate) O-methyltransferase